MYRNPNTEGRRRMTLFFFFQAEDGIRDLTVTGVQTCALPISLSAHERAREPRVRAAHAPRSAAGDRRPRRTRRGDPRYRASTRPQAEGVVQIGRASCRERV